MFNKLQNACGGSIFLTSLLVNISILSSILSLPSAYCTTDKQLNNSMTTTKYYALQSGVVMDAGVQNGAALIDKMVNATVNLTDYSADYAMTVYKNGKVLKESGTFYFRKPRLLRIEVKQGSRKGSLAILTRDGKIHGHLGGLMKYFSGTIAPDSNLAKAVNDFPMADTDFYSLASYLKNMLKNGDLSVATKEAVPTKNFNTSNYILDLYVSEKNAKLLLLKRIYVDPKTYLPIYWEDYKKSTLWSESSWQNVRTNLNLSNKLFDV
jgi:outer membrane lipoprotein-sorting protein